MKTKKLSVPRTMEEIQKEYQQLCWNAGQAQYQINITSKELQKMNDRIEAVNREGAARIQLDKDAKNKEEAQPASQGA